MGRKPKDESNTGSTTIAVGDNFSESYIEMCFLTWYQMGCPGMAKLLKKLDKDADGRLPSVPALARWQNVNRWTERADSMDAEVSKQIEQQAILEKVNMMKRHAQYAMELQKSGLDYLKDHKIDKSADAIRAIVQGMQEERVSRGMQIALDELSKMSDERLVKYIQGQMQKSALPNVAVVEGEIVDACIE